MVGREVGAYGICYLQPDGTLREWRPSARIFIDWREAEAIADAITRANPERIPVKVFVR